jgi:hypothetical protein
MGGLLLLDIAFKMRASNLLAIIDKLNRNRSYDCSMGILRGGL